MRILHTSDWHLGRTLHGVDLLQHQAAHVDHLVELTRSEDVDAVLVAGDVYDRAIPPVEAVALLSSAVARLAAHAAVVVTPGNHDSAIRLGFGADVLRPGVVVRARVADVGTPVLLPSRPGPGSGEAGAGDALAVYALPYLDPDTTRHVLADGEPDADGAVAPLARSHEAVMGAAMRRVGADLAARRARGFGGRVVVMGHAFVGSGQVSDSERDIRVGGVDVVPAGLFGGWGIDYVALGHLHGPQAVQVPHVSRETAGEAADSTTMARYSGSPLAFSFSELAQRKSTALVDLDRLGADPEGAVELVPAPVPRRLAEVTGTLSDLLGATGDGHVDDWLRVVVTDDARPAELYARVKARFPHALQVTHRPALPVQREVAGVVGPGHDPLDVARDFVVQVSGQAPSDAEDALLRTALEDALAMERSA